MADRDDKMMGASIFNPFESEEIQAPHSPHWDAKRRVAAALRDLMDVLVTSTPDTQDLHAIADHLEQQAEQFAQSQRLYGMQSFVRDGAHGGHGEINHELNAVGGWSNPLSPGLNMWVEGNRAFGTVNCGYAYEGPPDCIHGGFVAAILDQFLGMAQVVAKEPGMTGKLTVRYHKPTPLNADLDLRAEVETLGRRKTRVHGEILYQDVVTASAEGLFVRPSRRILPGQ